MKFIINKDFVTINQHNYLFKYIIQVKLLFFSSDEIRMIDRIIQRLKSFLCDDLYNIRQIVHSALYRYIKEKSIAFINKEFL